MNNLLPMKNEAFKVKHIKIDNLESIFYHTINLNHTLRLQSYRKDHEFTIFEIILVTTISILIKILAIKIAASKSSPIFKTLQEKTTRPRTTTTTTTITKTT